MLYTATDNTRIDFTIPSDSALRRIIVDPDVKPVGVWLGNKQIEQLATYTKGAKAEQAFVTPNNLTTILQCSPSVETSTIWSDFIFTRVGDAINQASIGEELGCGRPEKLDPLPVSHYMTEMESHIIEAWAGNVAETADPNQIIPDAPINGEGQQRVGRTRRKKDEEDDDDDEDEDEQDTAVPISLSAPKSMNYALNSQLKAQKAKSGRTRIKRIDEDEGEEEILGNGSASDAEVHNSWTYPPLPESKGFGYRSAPSRNRPGRQRIVKVDSDDEVEAHDPAWPTREQNWSINEDESSVIRVPTSLDEGEMSKQSNGWDDTVYPEISSFGAMNDSSEKKSVSVDLLGRTASPKDAASDRGLDKNPLLTTEHWSNFADETSKSSGGNEPQRKGRSRGRGSRGQGRGSLRGTSATQAALCRGHDGGNSSCVPQAFNQQYQGQSNNRGIRASRGTAPSGRRGNQPRTGGNKSGALAVDTLVDITEVDDVDPQTIPSPPGLEQREKENHQSVQAMPPEVAIIDEPSSANLIDVTAPVGTADRHMIPPPGFDCSIDAGTQTQICGHLPTGHHNAVSSASVSSQSMLSVPNTGAFYVNTSNPGMDLMEMSRRRLEKLHRARGEAESLGISTEKLQDVDESSTRTYHRSMNQQAKKETPKKKKEVDQKRAEALQNAWGSGAASGNSKASGFTAASPARKTDNSEMSATKKRLLRVKEPMADGRSEAADEEQTRLQNDRFVAALTPVFKAARTFPGTLNFEVQLGQFLSPSPEGAYQPKCVTVSQWHKLYDTAHGVLASAATFTNILTRNGADIDHILKLKVPRGGGAKLFHPDKPGRLGIRLEFYCQGKNNDEFKLVFNSRGEYEIERPFRRIGQFNIHVPGQIWDAAGMLTGSTRFPEEQVLNDAAEELARSVYIPEGRKEIEMSYRLPSSNEFAVKRVVMRRVSRHACAIMDKHDVQLQITEVQRLFVERRSDGIYLAYASKYKKMVDQMMIHFEVSLISESIERAMSANAKLAVGDMTTAWTEESLLQKWRTKTLLELTQMVVSKIDGVGFHNVGSAVFFLGQDSVLGGGSAVAIGSQMPKKSTTKLGTQNAHAAINVPGVRGGVAQPINPGYALGYGGARIPIPGYVEPDAVAPDDSASQAPEMRDAQGQNQVMPGFW